MTRKPPELTASDTLAPLLDRLLSAEQIGQLVNVHASTVYRWTREGHFPKPFMVGGGATRWRARDYNEWVKQKAEEESNGA